MISLTSSSAKFSSKIPSRFTSFLISLLILTGSFFIQIRDIHITGFEHRSNDEYLYLKSTREMAEDRDYLSPTFFGEYRFQKPILYYWLVIAAYKLFGVSVVSVRMTSALCGAITVLLTWLISRQFFNHGTG